MNPLFVCLSVVLLSQVSESQTVLILDESDNCFNGRNITKFLTSGVGYRDSHVLMIAKPDNINCTIQIIVSKGNYIMLVVEFIDWIKGASQCGGVNNLVKVMVSKNQLIDVCTSVIARNDNIFRTVGQNEISLLLDAPYGMNSVKITATSLRVPANGNCNHNFDIKCFFGNQLFCMTNLLKCDGHVNCGVRGEYDEETSHCERYNSITPAMIIVGLGIGFISFALLVALTKTILPGRKGTFTFKEDETLSEKDQATSLKYFHVKLRVLHESNEAPDLETIPVHHRHTFLDRISFSRVRSRLSKATHPAD